MSGLTDDQMIGNAATASQNASLIDDQVTFEAIQLNIINPLRRNEDALVIALTNTLSWLTSYPGCGAMNTYERARAALASVQS